jgi:hypothetical protein
MIREFHRQQEEQGAWREEDWPQEEEDGQPEVRTEYPKKLEKDKDDIAKNKNKGGEREERRADTKDEVMLEMLKFMKEERLNRSPKKEKDEDEESVGEKSTRRQKL